MKDKDSTKDKDSAKDKGRKRGGKAFAAPETAPRIRKGKTPPASNGKTPPAYMDVGMGNLSVGRDILLSDSDPNGSYTGVSREDDERPVQDADDL